MTLTNARRQLVNSLTMEYSAAGNSRLRFIVRLYKR